MSELRVTTTINTTPQKLWEHLQDISKHGQWMQDVESITINTPQKQGEGTQFTCRTKVGPFRTNDEMLITTWDPPHRMGVKHSGLITGEGMFFLTPIDNGTTLFKWVETLKFPLIIGGPVTAFFARPVLKFIWTKNLKRLKTIAESDAK